MNNLKVHPVYTHYAYNTSDNNIYHVKLNNVVKQRKINSDYTMCMVSNDETQKNMLCHRFIWECCNSLIPKNYEIDHINKIKTDNRIDNLRCVTMQENRQYRDHTNIIKYGKIAHTLKRFIKAISIDNGDIYCFKCKNQCAKYFGISPAMVYLIVENKNMAKTSNTNKGKIKFEYVDEKDVTNLIEIAHGRTGKKYK